MRHVSIVEILIVSVILFVLLLAVFPSFKRAQIMSGVTKNKISLAYLTKAVMKYNIDNEPTEISNSVFLKYKNDLLMRTYVLKFNAKGIPLKSTASGPEALSLSRFDLIPSEIHDVETQVINDTNVNRKQYRTYHIFGDSDTWENFYFEGPTASSHQYHYAKRDLTFLLGTNSYGFSRDFLFDEISPRLPYRGVTAGPLIDKLYETPSRNKFYMSGFRLMINNIVLYNPSNGTLSHGYLMRELTKEDQ